MRFEVLGPLRITKDGDPVRIGGPREQKVLAGLLLHTGQAVSRTWLIDLVWQDDPPATARAQIHNSIAALRRALGASVHIRTIGDGYLLERDVHELDLDEFRSFVAAQRGPAQSAPLTVPVRQKLCQQALQLWRGPLLDGLSGDELVVERQMMEDQRLACVEERLRLDMQLGSPVLDELAQLTHLHPLRERLVELRLRALLSNGQRVLALSFYDEFRRRLAEELGVDPSATLQDLYQEMLEPEQRNSAQPWLARRQLPATVHQFVGRAAALETLDTLLPQVDAGGVFAPTTGSRTVVISGTAGVGKTTLAIHWAHHAGEYFPDGQLYVNLQGYHPTEEPMEPGRAVRRFLDALKVPIQDMPVDDDTLIDLYRSTLAQRRVLIVVDNARSADQVRPLLPGGAGCVVVVTSRDSLTGLVASEGAQIVNLDLLNMQEATDLLSSRIGVQRTSAEPQMVEQIVASCAHLPLPLAAVAAWAAARPTFPLQVLAEQLQDHRNDLTALVGADAATDVQAVFSWSYRTLSPAAAELFRLLGLHDGPDVGVSAVAAMLAVPPGRATRLLAELTTANLINEYQPGRYQWHDLLGAYAAGLTRETDGELAGEQASARLWDHYVAASTWAAEILNPVRDQVPPLADAVTMVGGHLDAAAWFAAEYPVLLATLHRAFEVKSDVHVWQLARNMAVYCERKVYWQDWLSIHRMALQSAVRLGERQGEAAIRRSKARAESRLGRAEVAHAHLEQALHLSVADGDVLGEALTSIELAQLHESRHNLPQALDHAFRAVELFRGADHQTGLARALTTLGWVRAQRGELWEGLNACRMALAAHDRSRYRDLDGTAVTLDTLGYVYQRSGDCNSAVSTYRRAVNLVREIGADLVREAATLRRLGDCLKRTGHADESRQAWEDALRILNELDHPDAELLRTRLGQPAIGG